MYIIYMYIYYYIFIIVMYIMCIIFANKLLFVSCKCINKFLKHDSARFMKEQL